ncbi:MAG TPA: NAD(P)H-binding protein [Gaiellaceae bacterium]|nr:NAD(P)H-binding protein [Gaiellaceae bacterium]
MKAAVLGATGFVGRALVPALAEHMNVTAVSRSGDAPAAERVQPAAADALEPLSLRRALEGADIVYYLVHSLGQASFGDRDRRAAANVAAEAARAGVKQIVFLGGLGDDDPSLSEHLRSRAETARVLTAGDVPVTNLRAAVVIGRGSAGFETIVALVDRLPLMIAPRWVAMPTQPIALADVIGYLRDVGGHPDALGETFDLGGPDILTYRQMIERIGDLRGRRPHIVEVPVLSPRLSSYWLHIVTPVRAGVARPLVEGLRNSTIATDTRIRELLPRDLLSFDAAARQALSA